MPTALAVRSMKAECFLMKQKAKYYREKLGNRNYTLIPSRRAESEEKRNTNKVKERERQINLEKEI